MRFLVPLALLALSLTLSSCLPEADEGLSLHDVSLYSDTDPATLYGYFYGQPVQIDAGGRTLNLTEGSSDAPRAVPSALLVNGEPSLSQGIVALDSSPVSVQRTRLSTDLILQTNEEVGTVAYYDGSLWFTLAEEAGAGEESRVVPRERVSGLFGLGELTRDEASALERLLTQRGPVVVTALPETLVPSRDVGGLSEYRRTALIAQGLESEMSTDQGGGPQEETGGSDTGGTDMSEITWEELAQGTQASGSESPRFFVASSQAELENVWSQAYGNLLTPPDLPEIDFSAESVAGMFLGQQPTGGYGVSVQDVVLEDGEVYLQVDVTEPEQGAMTTQALTNPWVMVRVSRPELSNAWFREASSGELLGVAREGQ